MGTKSGAKQTTKTEGTSFKSLLPAILLGTAIVVAIGFIGRKATEP